jgi:Flp pilus assembly protein TadG
MRNKGMPRRRSQSGQAAVEFALLAPILMLLLFGVVQLARVYYTYHTLQKALRGGTGFIAHTSNVNYCDDQNQSFLNARNYIVFGNLQGSGTPVVKGLTPDMIQIIPERADSDTATVVQCSCSEDGAGCDINSAGRAPDYVVVNLGVTGFAVDVRFPFVTLGSIPLHPSVRMAVTGG